MLAAAYTFSIYLSLSDTYERQSGHYHTVPDSGAQDHQGGFFNELDVLGCTCGWFGNACMAAISTTRYTICERRLCMGGRRTSFQSRAWRLCKLNMAQWTECVLTLWAADCRDVYSQKRLSSPSRIRSDPLQTSVSTHTRPKCKSKHRLVRPITVDCALFPSR